MPLTDLQCRHATCPAEKKRMRLSDGLGMYLEVLPAGGKYWRLPSEANSLLLSSSMSLSSVSTFWMMVFAM